MKLAISLAFLLLTTAFHAHAQRVAVPTGTFVGSGSNILAGNSTAELKITESALNALVPAYNVRGTLVIQRPGTRKGGATAKLKGIIINDTESGKFTYIRSRKKNSATYEIRYFPLADSMDLVINTQHFGTIEISLQRRVAAREMTGAWVFPTGEVMNVRKDGSRYSGTYRGLPGSGHEDLIATLVGSLRKSQWIGNYLANEPGAEVAGSFSFRYFNSEPPVLTGQITTGATIQYELIKQ